MAARENRITKEYLLSLRPEEKLYEVMDTEIEGFGVRVNPGGRISFIQRWSLNNRDGGATLGRFPLMPVAAARVKAKAAAGAVARGEDPGIERRILKAAQTMKEFLTEWLAKHVSKLSGKTQKDYDRIVRKVLIPTLGSRLVADVTEKDAEEVHQSLADHPRAANMALAVLSSALGTAEKWKQRSRHSNPCLDVVRYEEDERIRALDDAEMAAFLEWLDENEGKHPQAVAQLRLLLMTGMRPIETQRMLWEWVNLDAGVIRIPKSQHKTGRKTQKDRLVGLGPNAVALLRARGKHKVSKWVFIGRKGPYKGLESWWQRRRGELAHLGLTNFHIYDLRHTFATWAKRKGLELDAVGDLLGHTNSRQTRRYAHVMPTKLRQEAGMVEGSLTGV
jgi:integrase